MTRRGAGRPVGRPTSRRRGLLVAAALALSMLPASGLSAAESQVVAGECVGVSIAAHTAGTHHRLDTPSGGVCTFTSAVVGLPMSAASTGEIRLWSHHLEAVCSGSAVQALRGSVVVTVVERRLNGTVTRSFDQVGFSLNSPPGSGPASATVTMLTSDASFAAAGEFVRSESNCHGSTRWNLGTLVLEDPRL